jgi:hypothetical protein
MCLASAQLLKGHPMLDLILVAAVLGLFVASVAYCYACDRL